MGKKSAPPAAPDYTAAAEKQAQSAQTSQSRADWANRPTVNTPWGQESWQAVKGIDPATGEPITQWTQNVSLSPDQQQANDQQMAIQAARSNIAGGMLQRVNSAYQQPFNFQGLQDYGAVPYARSPLLQMPQGPNPNRQQAMQDALRQQPQQPPQQQPMPQRQPPRWSPPQVSPQMLQGAKSVLQGAGKSAPQQPGMAPGAGAQTPPTAAPQPDIGVMPPQLSPPLMMGDGDQHTIWGPPPTPPLRGPNGELLQDTPWGASSSGGN